MNEKSKPLTPVSLTKGSVSMKGLTTILMSLVLALFLCLPAFSAAPTPDQIQAIVTAANDLQTAYNADQVALGNVATAQAALTTATSAEQTTATALAAAEQALVVAVQALPQPVQNAFRKALSVPVPPATTTTASNCPSGQCGLAQRQTTVTRQTSVVRRAILPWRR